MQNYTIDSNQLISVFPHLSRERKVNWILRGLRKEAIDILEICSSEPELIKSCVKNFEFLIFDFRTQSLRWLMKNEFLTIHSRDSSGFHILYSVLDASRLNNDNPKAIEMMSIFLEYGADIMSRYLDYAKDFSLLDLASYNLDVKMVEYLLEVGANPCDSQKTKSNFFQPIPKTKNAFYYANCYTPLLSREEQQTRKAQILNLFHRHGYSMDNNMNYQEEYQQRI